MCHTEMCDIMEMEKIVLIHDSLMRKEVDAFPMDEYFEVFMRKTIGNLSRIVYREEKIPQMLMKS